MRLYIREQRIKREGSPYYSITPGTITAGAFVRYSVEETAELAGANKYLPLDWMEIVNNDVVDIEVWVGKEKHIVVAGTIREVEGSWYDQFSITNLDAATASTQEKIRITCRRQPRTMDKLARMIKV